jgi:hypothetical protein
LASRCPLSATMKSLERDVEPSLFRRINWSLSDGGCACADARHESFTHGRAFRSVVGSGHRQTLQGLLGSENCSLGLVKIRASAQHKHPHGNVWGGAVLATNFGKPQRRFSPSAMRSPVTPRFRKLRDFGWCARSLDVLPVDWRGFCFGPLRAASPRVSGAARPDAPSFPAKVRRAASVGLPRSPQQ